MDISYTGHTKKSLTQVLHEADPKLNIVPARGYRHRKLKERDWQAATGVTCRNCSREVYRSRDGLCFPCWNKINDLEIRDNSGVLNLIPLDVVMSICKKPPG